MREGVVIDGVCPPIGRYGGGLSKVRPDDTVARTHKALIERTCIDPASCRGRGKSDHMEDGPMKVGI